jgi:hypothetical protein
MSPRVGRKVLHKTLSLNRGKNVAPKRQKIIQQNGQNLSNKIGKILGANPTTFEFTIITLAL